MSAQFTPRKPHIPFVDTKVAPPLDISVRLGRLSAPMREFSTRRDTGPLVEESVVWPLIMRRFGNVMLVTAGILLK